MGHRDNAERASVTVSARTNSESPHLAHRTASAHCEGELLGLAWDDPRGRGPWPAAAREYSKRHPDRPLQISWDVQPLSGFESRPIGEIAQQYDLLVMDHPHVYEGIRNRCLLPIGDLADEYVGRTQNSYAFDGKQWAAPIDASCHVAAWRSGAVPSSIGSWESMFAAADSGLRLGAPLRGVHSVMALLTLLASTGAEITCDFAFRAPEALGDALGILRRLVEVCRRSGLMKCLDWNPIEALRALAAGECDYLPCTFAYGYFARRGVEFGMVPRVRTNVVARGVLGGAGLAVSTSCRRPDLAIAWAHFVAGGAVQSGCWPRSGGQPAHRRAWDELAEEDVFYRSVRAAVDGAFVRPVSPYWNQFQSAAGVAIESWLRREHAPWEPMADELRQLADSTLLQD